MKTIARFEVPEDAYLLRSFLASRDIEAHVLDENLIQLAWYYSNALGGVRVTVDDEDCEEAVKSYREYSEALHKDPSPTTVARAWPIVLLGSLVTGVPTLLFGRRKVKNPMHPAVSSEPSKDDQDFDTGK